MPLYYAVGLLVLFYLLIVVEFFLPSGGIVGLGAVAAALAAIMIAFSYSPTAGGSMLLLIAASTPVLFFLLMRVWPYTPVGRRILNRTPGMSEPPAPERTTPRGTPLRELVGQVGVAKTNLLPSGVVVVDDQKFHAVSLGMPIDAGTRVIVARIQGSRLQVRPAEPEDLQETPRTGGSLDSIDIESLE